ncbi:MAG TPA: cupin domain-containing protein [Roseiflexaceae bacterium]|nr:cupin domain-containing protein [Roseiflexaceae bacterium]
MIIREQDETGIETPGGNTSRGLATPSRGAREVSVVRQRQGPGGSNPLHRHDREEVMVQCTGSVTVEVAGETVALLPGDTLVIPAGAEHRIRNSGDTDAEWLLVAPAGVRFFSAAGEEMRPAWAQ